MIKPKLDEFYTLTWFIPIRFHEKSILGRPFKPVRPFFLKCAPKWQEHEGEPKLTHIDLSPLRNLPFLTTVDLSDNLLSSIDLTPLRDHPKLETIDLSGNPHLKRIDLTPLVSCSSLQSVKLPQNDTVQVTYPNVFHYLTTPREIIGHRKYKSTQRLPRYIGKWQVNLLEEREKITIKWNENLAFFPEAFDIPDDEWDALYPTGRVYIIEVFRDKKEILLILDHGFDSDDIYFWAKDNYGEKLERLFQYYPDDMLSIDDFYTRFLA